MGLGVALVVGGLVLVLTASPQPADMGWFAYTPLNDGPDWEMQWGEGSAVFVTRTELLGWTGTASGLVVLASWAGYTSADGEPQPRADGTPRRRDLGRLTRCPFTTRGLRSDAA